MTDLTKDEFNKLLGAFNAQHIATPTIEELEAENEKLKERIAHIVKTNDAEIEKLCQALEEVLDGLTGDEYIAAIAKAALEWD